MSNIDTNKPYPKLLKCASGYGAEESFSKSNLSAGYFCNNCTYFIKDNHCAIVEDSGTDINGEESGIIAPYGSCDRWTLNKDVK